MKHGALIMFIVVAVVSSAMMFWRLGDQPMQKWDEGLHGSVSLEMVQRGAVLSMSYHEEPYWAKPPLKLWLTSATMTVLGQTELSVRLWSAISGVLVALLLAWWMYEVTGKLWLGTLAGIILSGSRLIFFHSFRTGETDGILVVLFVAAMYAAWKAWAQPRWWLWFGVLCGLLFMTKPLFGVFPLAIAGLELLLTQRITKEKLLWLLKAASIAFFIAAPWHLLMTARYGMEFWNYYVGFNVAQRASETLYANQVPWHWYWLILMTRFFPFITFLPLALVTLRRQIFSRDYSLARLSLVWAIVMFTAFSIIKTKFDWYILPVYPALILLVVLAIREWWEKKTWWMILGLLASVGWMWAEAPTRLIHTGPLWLLTPYPYFDRLGLPVWSFWPMLAVVASVTVFYRRPWIKNFILGGIGVLVLGSALWWNISNIRHLPTTSPAKELGQLMKERGIEKVEVVALDLRPRPDLYFYLRQANVDITENLALPSGEERAILTSKANPIATPRTWGREERGDMALLFPAIKPI